MFRCVLLCEGYLFCFPTNELKLRNDSSSHTLLKNDRIRLENAVCCWDLGFTTEMKASFLLREEQNSFGPLYRKECKRHKMCCGLSPTVLKALWFKRALSLGSFFSFQNVSVHQWLEADKTITTSLFRNSL